jgi:diguanylate cyclase (GGDEF)-like protein/PAS domain S-box-containing protein
MLGAGNFNAAKVDVAEAAYYKSIMEQANDIILVVHPDGKILDANQAALASYGYSFDKLRSLRVYDLRSPETRALIDEQIKVAQQEGILFRTVHMRSNGEYFPVEISSRRCHFPDGEVIISIVRDISKTIELENAIQQSEEKYRLLHEELLAAYEELTASEEELRQQFDELLTKEKDIYRQNIILNSLHDTALGLMNRRDIDELLRTIVANVTQLLGTPDGFINLVAEANGLFEGKVTVGNFPGDILRETKITEGLLGQVYFTGKITVINKGSVLWHQLLERTLGRVQSLVLVPLKDRERVIGILGLAFDNSDRRLDEYELFMLQRFADLAAIALDNATLVRSYKNQLSNRLKADAALVTSEAKYQSLFEAANDGIYIYTANTGKIVDINEKACEIYGFTMEEMSGGNVNVFGTGEPLDSSKFKDKQSRRVEGTEALLECHITRKDGKYIWVEINLKRAKIEKDDRIIAIVRDISERKKNETKLRKSQASNQALLNAIPDPMFVIRRDGIIADYKANKDKPQFSGKLLGKTVTQVFPPDVAFKMMQNIEMTLATGNIRVFEYKLPVNSKTEYYEVRIVVSGEDEVLAISRDITDRKRMEAQLEQLSLHDALTGLYNRAFFEEQMKQFQTVRGGRAGLVVCDVDGLKIVNDTLGHSMGDTILKAVATILKSSFRPGDIVARIGGDEFAVLINDNSVKVLDAGCRRIRLKIDSYNSENPTVPISLSLGFEVSGQPPVDINALFKQADNNMYREKLHRQKSARSAIVQALIKALEARDFITEGHGDRLQWLVESFATALGLSDSNIADLRLLAQFHDIGKVGIPDNVLFKPGPLTAAEWDIMHQHCEIGYRIAMAAPDLAPIAEWILKHQEWWNGTGYPLGIAGEDIPLECRILALADAYDAMTNDRPYRKAMSHNAAVGEIRKCAGTQFDPYLAMAFIEMLEGHDKLMSG